MMKFRHMVLLAGLLPAALLVHAQAPAQAQPPAVLISGPAGEVTSLDVEAAVQQFSFNERLARLSRPQEVRRIAEEVYLRRALAAQAEKAGTGQDPLTQAVLKVGRERVLSDAQIFEVGKAGWPSDMVLAKAAQERYQAGPKQFEMPALTRARQITLPKGSGEEQAKAQRERAEALRKELASGADFAELARSQSTDAATSSRGGDMGYLPKGQMLPEFDAALDKLQAPGAISEVIETSYGLHILKLEERKPAGIAPFADVRAGLIGQLRDAADDKARTAAVEAIKSQAKREDAAIEAMAKRFATAKD